MRISRTNAAKPLIPRKERPLRVWRRKFFCRTARNCLPECDLQSVQVLMCSLERAWLPAPHNDSFASCLQVYDRKGHHCIACCLKVKLYSKEGLLTAIQMVSIRQGKASGIDEVHAAGCQLVWKTSPVEV